MQQKFHSQKLSSMPISNWCVFSWVMFSARYVQLPWTRGPTGLVQSSCMPGPELAQTTRQASPSILCILPLLDNPYIQSVNQHTFRDPYVEHRSEQHDIGFSFCVTGIFSHGSGHVRPGPQNLWGLLVLDLSGYDSLDATNQQCRRTDSIISKTITTSKTFLQNLTVKY